MYSASCRRRPGRWNAFLKSVLFFLHSIIYSSYRNSQSGDKEYKAAQANMAAAAGGGKRANNKPTIVSPESYMLRFIESMYKYFILVPDFSYEEGSLGAPPAAVAGKAGRDGALERRARWALRRRQSSKQPLQLKEELEEEEEETAMGERGKEEAAAER